MINKVLLMKLDIKGLLVLALIAGALTFFWLAPNDGLQAAPELEVTTIDGEKINSAELKGKPYMVVFWATDCPGCVREIPHLNGLYNALNKEGFRIIAVAMPHDELPLIRTMREEKGMTYDIVFDEDGTIAKAFGGVKVTPTNVLISPQGKIALQKMGEFQPDDIRKLIDDMIKG